VSYDADSSLVNDYDNSTGSSGMPSRLRAAERPERNEPRQSRKRTGSLGGWRDGDSRVQSSQKINEFAIGA